MRPLESHFCPPLTLQRRTKSGFFGETVDLKGKYAESGYVSSRLTDVPYIPILILTLLGVGVRATDRCLLTALTLLLFRRCSRQWSRCS